MVWMGFGNDFEMRGLLEKEEEKGKRKCVL